MKPSGARDSWEQASWNSGEIRGLELIPGGPQCAPAHGAAAQPDQESPSRCTAFEEHRKMDAQTTQGQVRMATAGRRAGALDVALVTLAVTAIFFGNIFLVRAIDIALDAWMR